MRTLAQPTLICETQDTINLQPTPLTDHDKVIQGSSDALWEQRRQREGQKKKDQKTAVISDGGQ